MGVATEKPAAGAFSASLAGLQAGMVGVIWMLAWLGLSAKWQQRSVWTAENLMASLFYGASAIRRGFASQTVSGLALYLLIYSLLGALLAVIARDRLPRIRTVLVSILFALAWYYVSYHLLWKAVNPLVPLLHVERATVVGHVVYGTLLGRYPVYLARKPAPVPETEAPVQAPPV